MTAPAPAGSPDDANPRSFEAQFEEQQHRPIRWKALVRRSIWIAFTGVVLYLVAPSILSVLHSWPRLATLNLLWFIPAVVAEGAHFACTFALQRIALRTKAWFAVITAQLSGNAISLIVPGGAAAGAAVQFRMLGTAGMDATESVSGLTAFSFLGIGGLLALPVFVLPVVIFGAPVASDLSHAAWVGAIGFVLFTGFGAIVMAFDAPLLWAGRVAQAVRNRVLKKRAPIHGLPGRLLDQRNVIRTVLGQQWWQATLLSVGRLVFDYLCLLFCVRAVGAHPRPSLILLAYAVAGVIGLLPITPGGIGVVEASLAGFLALAGLDGAQAVLATLAYRLASYWLPMLAGPVAYAAFRHRYRQHGRPTPELPAPST
ncbi:MAG TPA: lysylphosphatidylglycerol synthase transmembrane domain-containing protein [Acidimicrobiales bacterium]